MESAAPRRGNPPRHADGIQTVEQDQPISALRVVVAILHCLHRPLSPVVTA
jgi:hypothetical protein